MPKVIIKLEDIKITPNGKSKLNLEINFEPAKRIPDSKAQELADYLLGCIDEWNQQENGTAKVKEVNRY